MGFLSLFKRQAESYSGSESYRYVEKLLESEKNILIVSPYIDNYYAKYLVAHAGGKRMYVISSAIQQKAEKILRGGGFREMAAAALSAIFLILIAASFFVLYLVFIAIPLGAIIFWFRLQSERRANVHLKIPKRFVHAKMYIGDGCAVEGSANLTFSGMHRNIESIRMVSDAGEISEMKGQFWKMWNAP